MHKGTGSRCLTYTGNFWRDRIKALGPPEHGAALWLPAYGPNDGKTRIDPGQFVPKGFRLKFHQWTDKGRVEGVEHQPVDCNVWLGTLEELKAFCHDGGAASKAPAKARAAAAGDDGAALARTRAPADGPREPMSTKEVQQALQQDRLADQGRRRLRREDGGGAARLPARLRDHAAEAQRRDRSQDEDAR